MEKTMISILSQSASAGGVNPFASVQPDELVFLVGAGVSMDAPTRLPSGKDLTGHLLTQAVGKQAKDVLFQKWAVINEYVHSRDATLSFPIPRLEVVADCFHDADQRCSRTPMLNGFASFRLAHYNTNHVQLAKLFHAGANLLTTNFDLCIERAFEQMYPSSLHRETLEGTPAFRMDAQHSVLHLHGAADNLENLGTTIRNIKSLNPLVKCEVLTKLRTCKLLVLVGYGVGDSFDITPFFEKLSFPESKPDILYFAHGKSEPPLALDRFSSAFSTLYVASGDTSAFLRWLCAFYHALPATDPALNPDEFQWRAQFQESWNSTYSLEQQLINLAAVRYKFGIENDILWPNSTVLLRKISRKGLDPNIQDYLVQATRSNLPSIQLRHLFTFPFLRLQRCGTYEYLGYYEANHLFRQCGRALVKYGNTRKQVSARDAAIIEHLTRLLDRYIQFDLTRTKYASYLFSCIKFRYLFSARFSKQDEPELVQKELSAIMDISFLEGVSGAYRHQSNQRFILYRLTGDKESLREAVDALTCAIDLSTLSGFYVNLPEFRFLRKRYARILRRQE